MLETLISTLQVIRGSGPGEVAAKVGRLRDSGWELRFDSEETAGYAEALMEQHEAKARAHVCEVRVRPATSLTGAGSAPDLLRFWHGLRPSSGHLLVRSR